VGWHQRPLIVLPVEIAHHWKGIDPPPDAQPREGWKWGEPDGPDCDYDRACGIAGDLGILEVGPGQALILGDMPMITAFLPGPDGGLLVRMGYAESVAAARRAVARVPEDLWQPTEYELCVGAGPLLLFDAGNAGDDPPEGCYAEVDEHIEVWCMKVSLPVGRYGIERADYKSDEET
jgi:hypothetical protein